MKTIWDAVELPHLSLKNRIVRSATWEALARPDGTPSDEQILIYRELAANDVGLLITGFTTVSEEDRSLGDGLAHLSSDEQVAGWQALTKAVHEHGSRILVQLALGEYRRRGRRLEPDDCSAEDLQELIQLFGKAARRAAMSGFDGIQLHGAHNFWLSRFLSPAYNHRQDEYGGAQAARSRLLLEIYRAVCTAAPQLHISAKMNCSDFFSGGLTPHQAMESCLMLAEAGIDSIEVSGNGTSAPGIRAGVNEAYFLPFARALKERSRVPVILVGGHRSIAHMETILKETAIELLSLSRPLLCEPNLLTRWRAGDTAPSRCISCNRCYQTRGHRCFFRKATKEEDGHAFHQWNQSTTV